MSTLLKLLEGRQQGSEIPLNQGTWHFGSDPDNDLVLDDDLVAAKHFSLTIDEEGQITVQTEEGAVTCLDGEPIGSEPQTVEHFQILRAGNTHLALGPQDATWPKPPTVADPEVVDIESIKHTNWAIPALGLVAVMLAMVTLWTWVNRPTPLPSPTETTVDVMAVLKELNLQKLIVTEDPEGRMVISGHLLRTQQEQQLSERLMGAARLDLIVAERVQASAREIVHAYLPGAQVDLGEAQEIILTGVCANEQKVQRLLAVLTEDLPAGTTIDNQLLTPTLLYPPLRDILTELKLLGSVSFTIEGGQLVVRGTPPSSKLSAWHAARDAFAEKWGISIVEHFAAPPKVKRKQEAPRKLDIHSVSIGEVSYITLEDGSKYFEGATLDNGAVLTHIAADHIVLRKSGRNTKYRLGG